MLLPLARLPQPVRRLHQLLLRSLHRLPSVPPLRSPHTQQFALYALIRPVLQLHQQRPRGLFASSLEVQHVLRRRHHRHSHGRRHALLLGGDDDRAGAFSGACSS